jgi:hypothetical protein
MVAAEYLHRGTKMMGDRRLGLHGMVARCGEVWRFRNRRVARPWPCDCAVVTPANTNPVFRGKHEPFS